VLVSEDPKLQTFQVQGQRPLDAAPALYSNFMAVSRVGTEVQFEFIFLDLNEIAKILTELKTSPGVSPTVQGKTVAKVVMPAASFVQLKEQLATIFEALEAILPKVPETENERRNSSAG
jgi:hypothetical protein